MYLKKPTSFFLNKTQIMEIPEIQIRVRWSKKVLKEDLIIIRKSEDIARCLREVFNQDTFGWTEEFIILCLNKANVVTGFRKISSGGMTGTVADPKVIFTVALNVLATSIILAHNHPSGNLKPSRADEELTEKIKQAGKFLDIAVLDHIILSEHGYFSFSDEGLL